MPLTRHPRGVLDFLDICEGAADSLPRIAESAEDYVTVFFYPRQLWLSRLFLGPHSA